MGYPKADFPELAEADARIKEPRTPDDVDELLEAIHAHPYFVEVQHRLSDFGPDRLNHSRQTHSDSQGGYTPARAELHAKIADTFFPAAAVAGPDELPLAWLCMGFAGAGKTSTLAKVVPEYTRTLAHLDADDIQMRLPGYEGWNADLFHREAHDVLWQELLPRAIAGRYRLVLDSTGHKMAEMKHVTDLLLVHGYQVRLLGIRLPAYVAAYRCWVRFRAGGLAHNLADPDLGRFVPPEAVLCCEDPGSTYRELRDNPHVAAWLQIDSSGPPSSEIHVIEQGER